MPPLAPSALLKHQKPHYSLGHTEVRPRCLWPGRLPWGLQSQLWCSKNSSNRWMGSKLALFGPSYEDKWLPRPVCEHHSAQKHANLSFSYVKLTSPRYGIARFFGIFSSGNGGLVESFVCGPTSLEPTDPSCVLNKNTSNHLMGSSLALRVPSYGDKWLPQPACTHHFAQKHSNL